MPTELNYCSNNKYLICTRDNYLYTYIYNANSDMQNMYILSYISRKLNIRNKIYIK